MEIGHHDLLNPEPVSPWGVRTPQQGPLLEYPPYIKYAESWLFLYHNSKNVRSILSSYVSNSKYML